MRVYRLTEGNYINPFVSRIVTKSFEAVCDAIKTAVPNKPFLVEVLDVPKDKIEGFKYFTPGKDTIAICQWGWKGKIEDCAVFLDSDEDGNPSYNIHSCPKCGEDIEDYE